MLSAGITKVAHLQLALKLRQPRPLALELRSAPAAAWFQVLSASGRQLIQDAQTG